MQSSPIHSPPFARRWLAPLALAIAAFQLPSPVLAQNPGWHSVLEANASTFFGATSQTLTALAADVSHGGEGFTADAHFKFRYGEAEDAKKVKSVNARGVSVSTSVDVAPHGRFSPFVMFTGETSLEARIESRFSGGAGAKWMFAKSSTGSASVSLAVLGERTAALADTLTSRIKGVARYSWRVKMDQRLDDKVSVSHATFYAPIVNSPEQFTVTSTTVGSYALSKPVALTVTFTDNYDSQAELRGAPGNNNGSLLFGVRGSF
ncbi:MAG TPA: DUF481 domain-containing protein [Gemmatimonadaceae bacterium]|nr:DUF481 domain-containing protein [Gemmatimonadaceae bacterium]